MSDASQIFGLSGAASLSVANAQQKPLQAPIAGNGKQADAREAAQSFEAQFLGQMFQLVTDAMPVDPVFGGGQGEKMFRSMLTEQWADSASQNGATGLSDMIMRELIQQQGGQF
jgi:Rod binding domain-containing protein